MRVQWEELARRERGEGIGSLTKPFTAAAIVLLSQQGCLDLDDPIRYRLEKRRA
jgi:CubicO group peptidase (beta-lactamase class C family)